MEQTLPHPYADVKSRVLGIGRKKTLIPARPRPKSKHPTPTTKRADPIINYCRIAMNGYSEYVATNNLRSTSIQDLYVLPLLLVVWQSRGGNRRRVV